MAEENQQKMEAAPGATPAVDQGVEANDRGLFDFLRKEEEEKPQEEVIASEVGEKVKVSETEHKTEEHKEEEEKEKKHGGLLEKLHRTNSSSSSSSDEEEKEGEEKKKKKEKKKQEQHEDDVTVPVEKAEEPAQPEDKGFLEKMEEKLPGHNKKTEDAPPSPPSTEPAVTLTTEPAATLTTEPAHEGEAKEKKGFLEKIKEKLPGYHAKTDEEKEKEKEKESASHQE